jgi:hypothetical protein
LNFQDGVNCLTFASLDEFNQKLEYYTTHLEEAGRVAIQGFEHVLAHHTTAHRAAYFLARAKAAVAQPGYCTQFIDPSIRALEDICAGIEAGCTDAEAMPAALA